MELFIPLKEFKNKSYFINEFFGTYYLGLVQEEEIKISRYYDLDLDTKLCIKCKYRNNTNNFLEKIKEELIENFIYIFDYLLEFGDKYNFIKETISNKDISEKINFRLNIKKPNQDKLKEEKEEENIREFYILYLKDKIYFSNEKYLEKDLAVNIIDIVYKGNSIILLEDLIRTIVYDLNNYFNTLNYLLISDYKIIKTFFNKIEIGDFLNYKFSIGKFFRIRKDKYKVFHSMENGIYFYKLPLNKNKRVYFSSIKNNIDNFEPIEFLNKQLSDKFSKFTKRNKEENNYNCNYLKDIFNKKDSDCKLQIDIINDNYFDINNYIEIKDLYLREDINNLFKNKKVNTENKTFIIDPYLKIDYTVKNFGIFKNIIEEDDLLNIDTLFLYLKKNNKKIIFYPLFLGNVKEDGSLDWKNIIEEEEEEFLKEKKYDLDYLFNFYIKKNIEQKELENPILFYDKERTCSFSKYPYRNKFIYNPYNYELNLISGVELRQEYTNSYYIPEYSFKIKEKEDYLLEGIKITEKYLNKREDLELINHSFFIEEKEHYIYISYKKK